MDNHGIAEALKYVANQADKLRDLELVEVGDRQYTFRDLKPVLDPQPDPISMTTLTGLVDYCKTNVDCLGLGSCLIQVDSPTQVSLRSPLTCAFHQRDVYAVAKHASKVFSFDRFMSQEEFIIGVNALFMQSEERDELLAAAAAVAVDAGATATDNGISQEVQVRTGARLVDRKTLKPRVKLKPFCTFMEVEQPEREFIFRLDKEGRMALFAADGDFWKAAVMQSIKAYLAENLPETLTIIA